MGRTERPSRTHHFWVTAKVLLRYKRAIALVLMTAAISAACFGAGISLIMPIMELLIEQKQDLSLLVYDKIGGGPSGGDAVNDQIGNAIASVIPADQFHAFAMVIGILLVLTVIGAASQFLYGVVALAVAQRGALVWRNRLFDRLIMAPLSRTMYSGNADRVSRLLLDTSTLAVGYRAVVARSVVEVLKILAALTAAFVINWQLSLIALVTAPLIGGLSAYFGRRIRKAARRVLEEISQLVRVANEVLGATAVVKVHHAEPYERRRFRAVSRRMYDEEIAMRQARALASPVNEMLSLIAVGLVATVAAWHIFRTDTRASEFVAVLGALIAAGASIRPLINMYNEIKEADAGAERVLEAMDTPTEPLRVHERRRLPRLPRHARDIVFEDVTVTYPNAERSAIRDINLHIPHGRRLAIVGGNGSGKTTLLSLLPRLIDVTEGRVLIDGVDIAGVNLRSLREQIGVVSQKGVLFKGTIAENIAYGRRWTPQDEVERVARAAFAHEFITQLPGGYEYELHEQGAGLSGGQRQRLCIARAMLRDPAILILDEATSQVDVDSEEKINEAIRRFSAGRTTLVIAHRLTTVIDADAIVVMDAGRIVAEGVHRQLLETCETYRILTQTQLDAGRASPRT